jgi:hypothetical protein
MQQVERNDIGGDRHEDERHRAFAGSRIIFLGIDPHENGPAAFYEMRGSCGDVGRDLKGMPAFRGLMATITETRRRL